MMFPGALRERNSFVGYTSIEGMPESFQGETTYIQEPSFRNMTMKVMHKQVRW